jgi:hypothetical protein
MFLITSEELGEGYHSPLTSIINMPEAKASFKNYQRLYLSINATNSPSQSSGTVPLTHLAGCGVYGFSVAGTIEISKGTGQLTQWAKPGNKVMTLQ